MKDRDNFLHCVQLCRGYLISFGYKVHPVAKITPFFLKHFNKHVMQRNFLCVFLALGLSCVEGSISKFGITTTTTLEFFFFFSLQQCSELCVGAQSVLFLFKKKTGILFI